MGCNGKSCGAPEGGFSLRGRDFGARYASKRMDAMRALGRAALAVAWRGRDGEWLTGGATLREALEAARADAEAAGIPGWCLVGFPGWFPLRGEVMRAGRCSVEASMGSFAARHGILPRKADRELCEAAAEALCEIAAKARQAKGR